MNYKFKKKNNGAENDPSYEYGVDLDSITIEKEYNLGALDWWGWTTQEVQMIIDESEQLEDDEDYTYQVEGSDFFIAVKKTEVLMWARESTTPDITWSFEYFIEFMVAFKQFIDENKEKE